LQFFPLFSCLDGWRENPPFFFFPPPNELGQVFFFFFGVLGLEGQMMSRLVFRPPLRFFPLRPSLRFFLEHSPPLCRKLSATASPFYGASYFIEPTPSLPLQCGRLFGRCPFPPPTVPSFFSPFWLRMLFNVCPIPFRVPHHLSLFPDPILLFGRPFLFLRCREISVTPQLGLLPFFLFPRSLAPHVPPGVHIPPTLAQAFFARETVLILSPGGALNLPFGVPSARFRDRLSSDMTFLSGMLGVVGFPSHWKVYIAFSLLRQNSPIS